MSSDCFASERLCPPVRILREINRIMACRLHWRSLQNSWCALAKIVIQPGSDQGRTLPDQFIIPHIQSSPHPHHRLPFRPGTILQYLNIFKYTLNQRPSGRVSLPAISLNGCTAQRPRAVFAPVGEPHPRPGTVRPRGAFASLASWPGGERGPTSREPPEHR